MKTIITILTILMGLIGFSQTDLINEKLSYHSFSITPIEIFFSRYADGIAISGDLSYSVKNNIISLSGTAGTQMTLFGKDDSFNEQNILYGKEFKLTDWFLIETHAGIGLFSYTYSEDIKETKTGIPLVTKLRFKTGDRFSLGLKLQANINSIENIRSFGIVLQGNHL